MHLMPFIKPVDPKWLSTLRAVEDSLAEDAFVYWYRNLQTQDGQEGEEGSFGCRSFWLVECLARANQMEEARLYFDKLLCHSIHLALFSEQNRSGRPSIGATFFKGLPPFAPISAALCFDRILGQGQQGDSVD